MSPAAGGAAGGASGAAAGTCGLGRTAWVQRSAGIRAVDAELIDGVGIPGAVLMEQAGAGVAAALGRWAMRGRSAPPSTLVLCGPGNNGGDGYVVARYLAQAGWRVRALPIADPKSSDCVTFHRVCANLGLIGDLADPDLVVDAVFGSGQRDGIPDVGWERHAGSGAAVVVLDVPSGVDTDTGMFLGPAPRSVDHVITIARAKPFLFTGEWISRWSGSWECVDIGFGERGAPDAMLCLGLPMAAMGPGLNKWDRGHVAVVAGAPGTSGAAVLACRAALRAGAGLVTLFPAEGARLDGLPVEVVVSPTSTLVGDGSQFSCVIVGPGLGRGRDDEVRRLWSSPVTLIVDADALRVSGLGEPGGLRLLTPHAGEAACWLGQDWRALEADRFSTVQRLRGPRIAAIYKGACPLVTGPVPTVHEGRCPTLGTAGSGDVLAGICGALVARLRPDSLLSLEHVANMAVAAQLAAGRTLRPGALASEVADALARPAPGGEL
ncbi:MAG: bifunctional ADP-dependent NAD(P)H-hydrate dehydratase/NAD(P)H-hydrate epimerase [Myxococcales bacterium]|nr:bifunctional ADP-dependent NAD(P)H-hydrate dehydratase/NAD(P)H-hydrate epimerase [Myxococcales bacterium]